MFDSFYNHSTEAVTNRLTTNSLLLSKNVYTQGIIMSDNAFQTVRLINSCVVSFVVGAMGVVGNTVNCLVFWRQGIKHRTNLSLFCLSFVDLFYVLLSFLFSCLNMLTYVDNSGVIEEYSLKTYQICSGVVRAFKATSGCFYLVITIERCLCVSLPLRATSWIGAKTMGVFLCTTGLLLQIGFSPLPVRYQVRKVNVNNGFKWILAPSDSLGPQIIQVIDTIVFSLSLVLPVVAVSLVTLVTGITVVKLREAMTWRSTNSSSCVDGNIQQVALTRMFVGVSVKFIVGSIPFIILVITQIVFPEIITEYRFANVYLTGLILISMFAIVDSSVNVFIYYSRSSRFKAELRSAVPCSRSQVPSTNVPVKGG